MRTNWIHSRLKSKTFIITVIVIVINFVIIIITIIVIIYYRIAHEVQIIKLKIKNCSTFNYAVIYSLD